MATAEPKFTSPDEIVAFAADVAMDDAQEAPDAFVNIYALYVDEIPPLGPVATTTVFPSVETDTGLP